MSAKHTCDSCGAETTGYAWHELTAEGWVTHVQNAVSFVMCGDCEREYAMRRSERKGMAL